MRSSLPLPKCFALLPGSVAAGVGDVCLRDRASVVCSWYSVATAVLLLIYRSALGSARAEEGYFGAVTRAIVVRAGWHPNARFLSF